ncbi:hypothetical protein ACQ4PT_046758 [Festuca glaucescens]
MVDGGWSQRRCGMGMPQALELEPYHSPPTVFKAFVVGVVEGVGVKLYLSTQARLCMIDLNSGRSKRCVERILREHHSSHELLPRRYKLASFRFLYVITISVFLLVA